MKTMQGYTTYCTEEQTIRAYKLGAPIGTTLNAFENGVWLAQVDNKYLQPVTTQQMIGWLREKGVRFHFNEYQSDAYFKVCYELSYKSGTTENFTQAELAAIDAALDYLEKGE